MLAKLKFVEGAKPGKKRKQSVPESQLLNKRRTYEKEVRERSFLPQWQVGRQWLIYNSDDKTMHCKICKVYWGAAERVQSLKPDTLKWLNGTHNMKKDAVVSHETSDTHKKAVDRTNVKEPSNTPAGETLKSLRASDISQMMTKFRTAHALAKWGMSYKMYRHLCVLDKVKGLPINSTYENDKYARRFISYIAQDTLGQLNSALASVKYLSITVDGCTDISGDEQESIYIHYAKDGLVKQHFVCFASPVSTTAENIHSCINSSLNKHIPEAGKKLVGITCDGASNMLGTRKGVATLFKNENPEFVAVHCLAHRLELAIKDVFKGNKLYEKAMTRLIGMFYLYKKSPKQKKELIRTFDLLQEKTILPTRVGGTRWVPHTVQALSNFFRGYRGFMTQMANASHSNPKSEGLYKLATDIHVLTFLMVLKDLLQPVQRFSLLLQRQDVTIGEVCSMKDSTIEYLTDHGERNSDELVEVLQSRQYKGFSLKGATPSLSYRQPMLDSIKSEITNRLSSDEDFLDASQIVNLKIWPAFDDKVSINEFGDKYLKMLIEKFPSKFDDHESLIVEWRLLKSILYRRYKESIHNMKWPELFRALCGQGVDMIMDLISLLLTFPATSVYNERSFSHMKMIKTDKRCRMSSTSMTDVMIVRMETPSVEDYCPLSAVNLWASGSTRARRPTFKRVKKAPLTTASTAATLEVEAEQETVDDEVGEDEGDIEEWEDDEEEDLGFESGYESEEQTCIENEKKIRNLMLEYEN